MTTSGLNADTRYAALITIDHDLECLASLPQSDIGKLQQPAPHAPSSIARLIASPTSLLGALHK